MVFQEHRSGYDIELAILKHLHIEGPSTVTELLYTVKVNHYQVKRCILDLAQKGLTLSTPIDQSPLTLSLPKGKPVTRSPDKIISKLNKLNGNVKFIITITPLGEKYLRKMNKLQNMLHWIKEE